MEEWVFCFFFIFSESLFETNHWLMFSDSWFTIWNKYLISLCVKKKLVLSANIIGSNMFEAFFKSSTYQRNRSGPKIEPCGTPQLIVSKLVFLFHWFERIVSYLRGSFWAIHDFCPLYHTVPTFLEEWSGLHCQKPSIGQWIHQVYICYFQKIQLFDQLIVLQHGHLNGRFGNWIV